MKVLILTVPTGGGHSSAAAAVAEGLRKRGSEVDLYNLYEIVSPIKGALLDWGYRFATEHLPCAYGFFYRGQENRRTNSYTPSARRRKTARKSKRLKEFLDRGDYDVIVFTHVFCGEMLDSIRERHGLDARVIGIVTDLTLHPYWEEALRIDNVAVASECTAESAEKKGYLPEQILITGIPVSERFYIQRDKRDARTALSLDESTPTVLIMSGSMGYGNMARTVRGLDSTLDNVQIICVCGENKRIKRKIERYKAKNRILSLGYTENVDGLMSAADLIITKPGGITVSEAMAKRLPIILYGEIPGPETHNARVMTECGAAVRASDTKHLCRLVDWLIKTPSARDNMKEGFSQCARDNAVATLCSEILKNR